VEQQFREATGDRVFFAAANSELSTKARAVLAAQAAWLKRRPRLIVTVEAHADEPGSANANLHLSAQRGEIVRSRLVEDGVDPARIVIDARGRDSRIAMCSAPECLAQNSRVVTRLTDPGPPPQARPLIEAMPTSQPFRDR
jgi:peptidoglycan-associated lipoprotein